MGCGCALSLSEHDDYGAGMTQKRIYGEDLQVGDVFLGKTVVEITPFTPHEYRGNAYVYRAIITFEDGTTREIQRYANILIGASSGLNDIDRQQLRRIVAEILNELGFIKEA